MKRKIIINEKQLHRVLNIREEFTGYVDLSDGSNSPADLLKTNVDGNMNNSDSRDGNSLGNSRPKTGDEFSDMIARMIPAVFAGRNGVAYGSGPLVSMAEGKLDELNQTLMGQEINVVNQTTGNIDYSGTEDELRKRKERLDQKKAQGAGNPGDDKENLNITIALKGARDKVANDKAARHRRGEENVYQKKGGTKDSGNGKGHKKITYFA